VQRTPLVTFMLAIMPAVVPAETLGEPTLTDRKRAKKTGQHVYVRRKAIAEPVLSQTHTMQSPPLAGAQHLDHRAEVLVGVGCREFGVDLGGVAAQWRR
jgi:hypothetical protein